MAAMQSSRLCTQGYNFGKAFSIFSRNVPRHAGGQHLNQSSQSRLTQRRCGSSLGTISPCLSSYSYPSQRFFSAHSCCYQPKPNNFLQPACISWSMTRTYAKKKGKDKGGKGPKKVMLSAEQLEGIVNMEKVNEDLAHVLDDLKDKFIHQLTVRTSQGVFDQLQVRTPDGVFPLIQLGQVVQKSAQLIAINLAPSPQYIVHVKEALASSGLNVNPQQDGTSLFINLPPVTRDHRETLSKNAKALSEKSKKQLRDIYSKYSRKIKSAKEGHSSDDLMAADSMVQDLMHTAVHQVEEMTSLKQKELLGGK